MYKQFLKVCLLGVMGLGLAAGAQAQTAIYGEFTGAKVSASNSTWMYGPTVGLYHDSGHGLVATGLDVRGTFVGRGERMGWMSNADLLGGVRLAITPRVLPIKPYGEVLGGLGHLKTGQGSRGLRRPSLRISLSVASTLPFFRGWTGEWWSSAMDGWQGSSDSFAPKTLSTGIVFRLP